METLIYSKLKNGSGLGSSMLYGQGEILSMGTLVLAMWHQHMEYTYVVKLNAKEFWVKSISEAKKECRDYLIKCGHKLRDTWF